MITLVDYGAGNVCSVAKALEAVGAQVQVTHEAQDVALASKIVLPGVGAFGDCMASLQRYRLVSALRQAISSGTPFLGICVGMQVLFAEGEEMGCHQGLGVLPGRVVRFPEQVLEQGLKIPHTGWNQLQYPRASLLFQGLPPSPWAYFNHAYYCGSDPRYIAATVQHGIEVPAAVERESLYGVQFHPEKSQLVGLRVLRNFVEASR